MAAPPPEEDATVRLSPAAAAGLGLAPLPPRPRRSLPLLGGAVALAGLGAGLWLWPAAPPRPAPEPPPPAEPPWVELPAPPLLTAEAILAHRAGAPTAFRWAANPLVWVLDFPTLEAQGLAFNRAAALVEKAATPRERALPDAELAAAIAADGRTTATWYFGHNYRASDLARLFALMEAQGIAPNPLEAWVREQVRLSQRLDRARDAAFLSIPALGAQVDLAMRASILRHELAHGQFFTLPFFAAHVMRVWQQGFTEVERRAMREFLARDGYDPTQEEVMANEAMAYLLHTPDRRFFDPARDLGWSDAQAARLRALFAEGAPPDP
jgi:hypothetical protein